MSLTLHLVPGEDFHHEVDHKGGCPCGPELRRVRQHPYFRHWALDPRFYPALPAAGARAAA